MPVGVLWLLAATGLIMETAAASHDTGPGAQYAQSPFVFPISPLRADPTHAAMLLLGDLDQDGETDYIVMSSGGMAAYDHWGRPLWRNATPPRYFAGPHADWVRDDPNALRPMASDLHGAVADVDGDGRNEFVFLDAAGYEVVALEGASGREKRRVDLRTIFEDLRPCTHVVPSRLFRQTEDSGMVVVSHPAHVPFQGKDNVLVFDWQAPQNGSAWRHDEVFGICYAPARAIDLDGDGWDEVIVGLDVFDRQGRRLWQVEGRSDQYTTLQIGSLLPGPSLEVVIGEYGHAGTDRGLYINGFGAVAAAPAALYLELSQNTHSVTLGRFLADSQLEQILIRNNTHRGTEDVRRHRILDPLQPENVRELAVPLLDTPWTDDHEGGRAKGEYPRAIDWDGDAEAEILAVERHTPRPRASVHKWRTGERLLLTRHTGMMEAGVRVCDVSGDGREEVLVWNETEVAVYFDPSRGSDRSLPPRRSDRCYQRLKSVGNVIYNAP